MQYYRCKCGKSESWTTMGVQPCDGCDACGTTMAQSSSGHETPIPHEWVTRYNPNTGAPFEVCKRCLTKKVVR